MEILIVEDDIDLCDTLADALASQGFVVSQAYNGEDALEKLIEHSFELLILDINLPNKNGFEVLREARLIYPNIAALFMTALDTPEHLENSFKAGGDDYIRKPFTIKELCFRLNAIHRRFYALSSTQIHIPPNFIYETSTQTLLCNGATVPLKAKLSKLLYLLAVHPSKIVGREMIEERLWENEELPDSAILRIYIKELRYVLGSDSIETVRGVGYRLKTT